MGRSMLYLLVLAGIAAASTWFLNTVESSLREPQAQDSSVPLLYIDNFTATRLNALGNREYTLSSPRLTQFPGQGGTFLQEPDLSVFENEVRTWLIHAKQGWVAPRHQVIQLQDGISMVRPASSSEQPAIITARNLRICPEENIVWQCPADRYLETADAVRLETPDGVVNAVGMKVYLDKEQLELLSEVRGYYEPPTP